MGKLSFFWLFLTALLFSLPGLGTSAEPDKSSPPSVLSKLPPHYVLDKIKGTVLVLSKGSEKPEPAEEEQMVQEGDEVITQASSEASLTLNEITMFQVSANSRVKVEELNRKSPVNFITRLKLASGSLLAQVEKLLKTKSVFEVEAGGVICGVRGTAFEVQSDGSTVDTSTFEGKVEMKKSSRVEEVPADRHSSFSTSQGVFLRQRLINEREKARYQNWVQFRSLMAQREKERRAALRAFDFLPKARQEQILEKVRQASSKEQLIILRQMLREKNLQKMTETKENAAESREDAAKERQKVLEQAQEQRQKELQGKQTPTPVP